MYCSKALSRITLKNFTDCWLKQSSIVHNTIMHVVCNAIKRAKEESNFVESNQHVT